MDNLKMNKRLGTKWFTFYTKVRPWLACLSTITVVTDFMQYIEVYTSYWWMFLYFIATITQAVLGIVVFVKSQDDYVDFVRFVKGVLLFEIINMAYGKGIQQYIQNDFDLVIAFITAVTILLLGYFVWYRLNVKYFEKRINSITIDRVVVTAGTLQEKSEYEQTEAIAKLDKICFCRKCGEKLIDNSQFCRKCGTEVIKE